MNSYLLTLVLKPDLAEKDRTDLLDAMKKKMLGTDSSASSGQVGKITKEDMWGNRDLTYAIKKQTKGYFAHFEFETDPKIAKTLDKNLRVEEDIIRYLFVRV